MKISYVHDNPSLKGTSGAVLSAYKQGVISTKDTVLVYYGDILTDMNLQEMLRSHIKRKASATVALAAGFAVRVGVAELDDHGKIKGFVEKPTLEKPVSIGILVLDGAVLGLMDRLIEKQPELDLMRDVIPHLIEEGKPVYGHLAKSFWYDVGSTEAYEKLDPKLVDETMAFLF